MQDNGTALSGGSSDWPAVLSGNGGYSAINPLDENQQLAESDGDLILTTDAWASSPADITPPGEPSAAANFVPPAALVANPSAPDSPRVYYGGADLWATRTRPTPHRRG